MQSGWKDVSDRSPVQRLRRLAGGALILVGVVVLVGWNVQSVTLTSISSALPPMKPLTAALFVVVGIVVMTTDRPGLRRSATTLGSLIVMFVAFVEFSGHAQRRTLWIDNLLFADTLAQRDVTGQMAVSTALGFALLALALAGVRLGLLRLAQLTAVAGAAVGYVAVLGYVYGIRDLYSLGSDSAMALHTSLGLLVGGIGVLCCVESGVARRVLMDSAPGAVLLRRALPSAFVGLPIIGWIRLAGERWGWYGLTIGLALMVMSSSLLMVVISWRAGSIVDRFDSERAAAAEKTAALNVDLEARVLSRTADLAASEQRERAAAASLTVTNEQLSRLVRFAPIGIALYRPTGEIVEANAALERMLGIDPGSLIGDRLRNFVLPDLDLPDKIRSADDLLAGVVDEIRNTTRFRRSDGGVVVAEVYGSTIRDASGAVEFVLTQFVDVTIQEEARLAARRAEAQFRSAFDDAPIGVALVDADRRLREVNAAFVAITTYEATQLIGMRLPDLCHPDDVADAEQKWNDLADRDRPFRTEHRMLRPDGSVLWVSIHASPIDPADGGERMAIAQVIDISEQHHFQAELAHIASHDPLTGLLNRRAFETALEHHVSRCARYGAEGAVLMLDLDHFKRINDTLGHHIGDQLIISAARALQGRLRDSDVVARLGGDEFAVLLARGNAEDASTVAASIVDAVRNQSMTLDGRQLRSTASIGVAVFDGVDRTGDEMLVNADLAMYDAKEHGRDRWAIYEADRYDGPRIKARLTWMDRIERALEDERFVLWAQPIERLVDGSTFGYELLIRMQDDHGDLIPPATFLYVAERFGLIQQIDRWVITQVTKMLGDFHRQGRDVTLTANISGLSLSDDSLLEHIEARLRAEGFPADRLVLEVTETAAIANIAAGRIFAERLRQLGCRFALDDFGAGFGSFYYVKHLPFDFVKIDGEFVKGCIESTTDQSIIRSLVRLAQDLGKETIAEHVESEQVRQFLREQGVDHAQGYHLGRPAPMDHLFAAQPAPSSLDRS